MVDILYYAEELSVGGVENMMLQWVKHMPPEIHIDLFVSRISDNHYIKAFGEYGCQIFCANCKARDVIGKYASLNQVLKKKHYDIVHLHTSSATDFFVLMLAKRNGIKVRIAHSHNVPVIIHTITRMADRVCKPLLRYYTTEYYGCSKDAIYALFGSKVSKKEYHIIKNGIETNQYSYSLEHALAFRHEINVKRDTFIIGSVGRLDFQKDYMYLLNVINEINGKLEESNIIVVIVGEGNERNELEEYARSHAIDLRLLGKRNDVNKILSGFDLFVLTSRFEGFPVVVMEAQANGLTCLVSEAVPDECLLNKNSKRISRFKVEEWADTLKLLIKNGRNDPNQRLVNGYVVKNKGYDISDCTKELTENYLSYARKCKVK